MDLRKELDLYLTTMHPLLNLGTEVLRSIKYTDPPGSKNNIFLANSATLNSDLHQKPSKKQKRRLKKARNSSSSPIAIPAKRLRTSLCPCCQWTFPYKYSNEDINIHVTYCLDGQGQQDIDNYTKKAQERKRNKNKPTSKKELSSPEILTSAQEVISEPRTVVKKCPYCNLSLSSRTENFIKQHLECCKAEQALHLAYITRPKLSLHQIFNLNFLWY